MLICYQALDSPLAWAKASGTSEGWMFGATAMLLSLLVGHLQNCHVWIQQKWPAESLQATNFRSFKETFRRSFGHPGSYS